MSPPGSTQRILRPWRLLCLLLPALFTTLPAQASEQERLIKAGFISKFPAFVTWPSAQLRQRKDGFRLCVLGSDPILSHLKAITSERKLNGRPAEVAEAKGIVEAETCDLLFLPKHRHDDYDAILERLGERPILLVAESPGAAERGFHINLLRIGDRIRFVVSRAAFERSGLAVSFRLLEMAMVVR